MHSRHEADDKTGDDMAILENHVGSHCKSFENLGLPLFFKSGLVLA
jgi:hypothetical protein